MSPVSSYSGLPLSTVSPSGYIPQNGATPAAQESQAAPLREIPPSQASQAKPDRQQERVGFNPSVTIDPDTHVVVMTVSGPDGKTIRQIPNEHEVAAYKASEAELKKSGHKA